VVTSQDAFIAKIDTATMSLVPGWPKLIPICRLDSITAASVSGSIQIYGGGWSDLGFDGFTTAAPGASYLVRFNPDNGVAAWW
jgi:hypothetical protein